MGFEINSVRNNKIKTASTTLDQSGKCLPSDSCYEAFPIILSGVGTMDV